MSGETVCGPSLPDQLCARQRDEGVLQVLAPGLHAQFVRRAASHDLPAGDDDDRVAECGHLLHDVAGKEHTAAGVAEASDDRPYGARAHHIETVGWFVEKN